ncbi:MAG: PilZ domain-containing protein [Deltaproteobacteria bacterium]|nr:PilZ domain-containing protein [Deltaproteobacteria bacterium]
MTESDQKLKKYEIISHLFELVDSMPKNKQMGLLQRLAADHLTSLLYKLIVDMPENEQQNLVGQMEELILGKRIFPRKECLITTDYVVKDRAYQNFVKDLGEGGVYVQTNHTFEVGDEITQSFSLSEEQIPFKFAGEIVRVEKDGFGIKFKNLTQYQKDILNTIIKKMG